MSIVSKTDIVRKQVSTIGLQNSNRDILPLNWKRLIDSFKF